MEKKTLAFVDIETTGFNIENHEIIEIACILVKHNGTDYETIEEIEIKVKPNHIETADPQALRINGYNDSEWMFAYTLEQAMQQLAEKTKGAVFVAHNVAFDWSFLAKAFAVTGIEPQMDFRKLDTISIAYAKFSNHADVNKFSLKALAEYFDLTNEKAHTALADTRVTVEIFKKLMAM
jgi:DNA polymerase III epsilon subunit-like protein